MEKVISKKAITETIKTEYALAKEFCSHNPLSRGYDMMIDTSDGKIWSDVFLNKSDTRRYYSKTIQSLDGHTRYDYTEVLNYTVDAVRLLRKAGWIVND